MPADNNLDDLFRQQLGPHATPPGPDLQRRLAELAEAERLDQLFRAGLGSHASQPRRELWERLEDEHLHPQPRRQRGAVAWWQLAAAAMLLLALLGGGLWRGGYLGPRPGLAITKPAGPQPGNGAATLAARAGNAGQLTALSPGQKATKATPASTLAAATKKNQENNFTQATAASLASSSTPIATTTRPRRPTPEYPVARSYHAHTRPLDAAAGQLAAREGRHTPAGPLPRPTSTPAPEAPALPETPTLAAATVPTAPVGVIEVEVRRGLAPTRLATPTAPVVAAAAPGPVAEPRRRLRLGGLLRQADHLVHGEALSLAEATGLPESLTVQAHLGSRVVSKTIQL